MATRRTQTILACFLLASLVFAPAVTAQWTKVSGAAATFAGGSLSVATDINNELCLTFGTTVSDASPCITFDTTQTVDTGMLLTGSVSNAWVIAERSDEAFDFAHAATTNPTLFIHSNEQNTTDWISLTHDGTHAVIDSGFQAIQFTDNLFMGLSTGLYFMAYANTSPAIYANSTQTPDTMVLGTGTAANSWIIAEQQDTGFDFAHAQATNPTLFIHSADQTTTEWLGLYANVTSGGNLDTNLGKELHGANKALTAGSATSVFRINLATLAAVGGEVQYVVYAADGTDVQSRGGTIVFQAVNKAATETCTISTSADQETEDGSTIAASSGTLTYTWTTDVTPTNGCDLQLNAASSLTETSLGITYNVVLNGNLNTPSLTPQ